MQIIAVMWNSYQISSLCTKNMEKAMNYCIIKALSTPMGGVLVLFLCRLQLFHFTVPRKQTTLFLDTVKALKRRDSFEVKFGLAANKGMISLTFRTTQRVHETHWVIEICGARNPGERNVMSSEFRHCALQTPFISRWVGRGCAEAHTKWTDPQRDVSLKASQYLMLEYCRVTCKAFPL